MESRDKRSNASEGAKKKEIQVLVQGRGHHEIFCTPPDPVAMGLKVLAFMTAYGIEMSELDITVFGNLTHVIKSNLG